MRILYLINSSSLADGIARHIISLCEYFVKRDDVEVAVCVTHDNGEFPDLLQKMGVMVYVLRASHGHDIKIFRAFHKVMKEFKPSLIHSHVMALNIRIYLAVMARKIPVVKTLHMMRGGQKTIIVCIKKFIINLFKLNVVKYLAVSSGVRDAFKDHYGKNCDLSVIYNPVSLKHLPNKEPGWLRSELGLSETAVLVGFIGRLAEIKGLRDFLEMAQHLISASSSYHFVVVGDGTDYNLKDSESAVSLGNNIHWMGYRTDAKRIMAGLDVFVLTSKMEAMPTVLLEAFSVKTPVCAFLSSGGVTDIYNLAKHYQEGVASIVKNRDVKVLAEQVMESIQSFEKTGNRVENAYHLVSESFDVSVIGTQVYDVYCDVFQKHANV